MNKDQKYGLRVGHSGMCKCPFHNDRNPSMKVDKRFHCFGCQADGDVINFASRLFSITPREAALRLAEDFDVQYDPQTQTLPVRRNNEISEAEYEALYNEYNSNADGNAWIRWFFDSEIDMDHITDSYSSFAG